MSVQISELWKKSYSIEELNFLAENMLIEIMPNVKTTMKDNLNLACGSFDNLKPNKKMTLPIWMAVKIRQKSKCKIYPPYWMEISFLKEHIELEKKNVEILMPLPYYFFEIIHILSYKAQQDIPDIEEVKNYCADISIIRNDKINNIITKIKEDKYFFKIKNICARELEVVRPIIVELLNSGDEFFNVINNIENKYN